MSVPNVLFIDTSILDQQNYNFESAVFIPFIEAVKGKSIIYLLPNPTLREINRHIAERADNVIKVLEEARRKAPFLNKYSKWPDANFSTSWELRQLAMKEWRQFLKNFEVVRLNYEGVNLMEIMDWYDKQRPPFSPKKSKEFPDALALSSLLHFSRKSNTSIAIISTDPDFKNASDLFTELLYFESLPAYNEALIANDQRVDSLKLMLEEYSHTLAEGVINKFLTLNFYPSANAYGSVENVEVADVEFESFHILSVGAQECTIAFSACIYFEANVEYEPDDDESDPSDANFFDYRYCGQVSDHATVKGIIKMGVDSKWMEFSNSKSVQLENEDVSVSAVPPRVGI